MLGSIRIVLVQTSHPGNIGSTARAMKTMGLTELVLVKPKFFPDPKATELASGADDILDNAIVVETLEEALAGMHFVYGVSARTREIGLQMLNPREAAVQCEQLVQKGKVAYVFGQEKSGLSNEQLALCQQQVIIPSNPDYGSLNLSQAVQVISYECRMQVDAAVPMHPGNDQLASYDEVRNFYDHLHQILIHIGFIRAEAPRKSWERIHRLFNRAHLEVMEVSMLRGVLSAIEKTSEKTDLS